MSKVWRLSGGTILEFTAPVTRPGGATMFSTQGKGAVCLENGMGARTYLTMLFVGNDLIGPEGRPVEGYGVCTFSDLEGNVIYGKMRLDVAGVNDETMNSLLLTIESGCGKFEGCSGQMPLVSKVSPSDSDTRYFGFLEGEGSVHMK